jgi:FkbM family methyltransferase
VVLDVGANTGEWSARLMDEVDSLRRGSWRCRVRLVLIEPQPVHHPALTALVRERGGHLIKAAAWTADVPSLPFYHSANSQAASLMPSVARMGTRERMGSHQEPRTPASGVRGVDFARVLSHATKDTSGPVLMKLDVEGSEYSLLPRLLLSGALCRVDYLFVEWHLNALHHRGHARLDGLALRHGIRALLSSGCSRERVRGAAWPQIVHDENAYNNYGEEVPGLARIATLHTRSLELPGGRRWDDRDFDAVQTRAQDTARQYSHSAAGARWLKASSVGHCGATEYGAGDCAHGAKGAWALPWWEVVDWHVAAASCLRRCARCAQCRHISVSLQDKDCSWYLRCDALTTATNSNGDAPAEVVHRSGASV